MNSSLSQRDQKYLENKGGLFKKYSIHKYGTMKIVDTDIPNKDSVAKLI